MKYFEISAHQIKHLIIFREKISNLVGINVRKKKMRRWKKFARKYKYKMENIDTKKKKEIVLTIYYVFFLIFVEIFVETFLINSSLRSIHLKKKRKDNIST